VLTFRAKVMFPGSENFTMISVDATPLSLRAFSPVTPAQNDFAPLKAVPVVTAQDAFPVTAQLLFVWAVSKSSSLLICPVTARPLMTAASLAGSFVLFSVATSAAVPSSLVL